MNPFLRLLDRPIAFHRAFVDLTESVGAALFLSQAVYWQKRIPGKPDEWWFKSQADWTDETGLSRREQESARKCLKGLGILQEQRVGVPAKLMYRVDNDRLSALLMQMVEDAESHGHSTRTAW